VLRCIFLCNIVFECPKTCMHFSTMFLWVHYINLNSRQCYAGFETLLLWALLFIRLKPLMFQMAGLLSSTMYFSFWMDKSLWAYLSLHGNLPACPQCYHMYLWRPIFSPGVWDKHPVGPSTRTTDMRPVGGELFLYKDWVDGLHPGLDQSWKHTENGICRK